MAERRELLHLLIKNVTVDLKAGGLRIALHELPPGGPGTAAEGPHAAHEAEEGR